MRQISLHVNVDHVATLRNARGSRYPDPIHAAVLCELAGADGITVHLREDRRHIRDRDLELMRASVGTLLNLEMAATDEMVEIALRIRPDVVTLVPEKREERTTEGGLDVVGQAETLAPRIAALSAGGIEVSLFIDPEAAQVETSATLGATRVELHTGDYANASRLLAAEELDRLARAGRVAHQHGLHLAAGHGLTSRNVRALVATLPDLVELNIGHALMSDALFVGMEQAVRRFRSAIDQGAA